MALLVLIPIAVLGVFVWVVVATVAMQGRVRKLEEEVLRMRRELELARREERGPKAAGTAEVRLPRPDPAGAGEAAPVPPVSPAPAPPIIPGRVPIPPAQPPVLNRLFAEDGEPEPRAAARSTRADVNLENFLGVKMFAWIGGLVLALGIGFFIKYSFEHNLISPALRVVLGGLVGLGLVVGGLFVPRPRYLVTAQTLCASGILALGASIFAAQARYGFIGVGTAFGLMGLVTFGAFLLAARLDAQVIAILGLLTGFLMPPLIAPGVPNPLSQFGYIALLDVGLIALARRQRWDYLSFLAAIGTLVLQVTWIAQLSPAADAPTVFAVIAGFALVFALAGAAAARKQAGGPGAPLLCVVALIPFVALSAAVSRLALVDPAVPFTVGLVVAAVFLGLARAFRVRWLPLIVLGSVLMPEAVWFATSVHPANAAAAIAWFTAFAALCFALPFTGRAGTPAWAAGALSLPLHFFLVYRAFRLAAPGFEYPGLVPAAFALPCLAGFAVVARPWPPREKDHVQRAALLAGAALFFITLVFSVQLKRQWLTIAWALEGAALIGLFRRIPGRGLRVLGALLLAVAFVRLAFNDEVFRSYERAAMPLLNWYLYAYGVVAASLALGGWWLRPSAAAPSRSPLRPALYALAAVLAFVLLNLEIADYFTPRAEPLAPWEIFGSWEKDMTCSLAWALFAAALLGLGFRNDNPATRYAGMGLLVVTILKLFLHDLWRLGGLYRIGALVGLAVVLILVSFVYQRFLARGSVERQGQETGPTAG